MAHELEIKNGIASMFSVEKTPWHGLGHIIGDAPSTQEGIKLAGLDWTVSKKDLFTSDGVEVSHKATVRDSDGQVLGVVGPKYQPLQNKEAFSFFDPFIQAGEASLETAGSLRNGSRIWVLAKLNKAPLEVTKNDLVEKFLLLSNGHDGTLALRVGFTPIRVVCANTMAMAHGDNNGSKFVRIVHGSKVAENLEKVREVVNAANAEFEATAEQMRFLASRQINTEDLKKYVKVALDLNFEGERAKLRNQQTLEHIMQLFENSPGSVEAGHTYWGAYNAVNYHLNYEKGRDSATRLNNLWFGSAKNLNEHAFELATEMAR